MYSCGPPHMDVQEWDDQHELTYSSYVRTRDVTLKTCRRRWMIGRNGEKRSGISAQAARHDDNDLSLSLSLVQFDGDSNSVKSSLWIYFGGWLFTRFSLSPYIYIYIYKPTILTHELFCLMCHHIYNVSPYSQLLTRSSYLSHPCLFVYLFVWVLWHINLCWVFNAKSIFI